MYIKIFYWNSLGFSLDCIYQMVLILLLCSVGYSLLAYLVLLSLVLEAGAWLCGWDRGIVAVR